MREGVAECLKRQRVIAYPFHYEKIKPHHCRFTRWHGEAGDTRPWRPFALMRYELYTEWLKYYRAPAHIFIFDFRDVFFEQRPDESELQAYTRAVVGELQALRYIGDVEVCDPTWIPVAYTWRRPGSTWSEAMQRRLEEHDIVMAGRYGRWSFQGVTDSIAEGLQLGTSPHSRGSLTK